MNKLKLNALPVDSVHFYFILKINGTSTTNFDVFF